MCPWVGPHAPSFGRQLWGLPSRVEYLSPQGVLLPLVYGTTASLLWLELQGHSAWQATPSWTVYWLTCHWLLPWLQVTFAMVPDAAWPGSDQWPSSTAPATGLVGRLGRPSASDPWGVGSFLSLGRPTCVQCPGPLGSCSPVCLRGLLCCVCGVLGHLAPVHRCARSVCCVACAVSTPWSSPAPNPSGSAPTRTRPTEAPNTLGSSPWRGAKASPRRAYPSAHHQAKNPQAPVPLPDRGKGRGHKPPQPQPAPTEATVNLLDLNHPAVTYSKDATTALQELPMAQGPGWVFHLLAFQEQGLQRDDPPETTPIYTPDQKAYKCYWHKGTPLYARTGIHVHLVHHLSIPGRLGVYEVVGDGWQLDVINAHVPFGNATEPFFPALAEAYRQMAMLAPTIIIGNMNAP